MLQPCSYAALVLVALASPLAGCVLQDIEVAGRPCPCVDGYRCDPALETCVVDAAGGLSGAGEGGGTSGGGAATGGRMTGGGGEVTTGGGDGDVGGSLPLPDAGVVGDVRECAPIPTPASACPPECSNCDNGICTFVCHLPATCMGTSTCPPGWPCVMDCAGGLGAGACNTGKFLCADGPCELRCDISSCTGKTVVCGTGPCRAVCPARNATIDCGPSCLCAGTCE